MRKKYEKLSYLTFDPIQGQCVTQSAHFSTILRLPFDSARSKTPNDSPGTLSSKWFKNYAHVILVASSPIGSTLANYWRFLDLSEDGQGKTVTKSFENRFYFPVSVSFINTVNIELRQMSGQFVPLKGCTRIVLHFRKKEK